MKLALVALLAMCAMVASSPINEEKRTELIADLLRELVLEDVEADAKHQTLHEKAADPVQLAINDMRWWRRYSYLILSLEDNKWVITVTGSSPFSRGATVESKFNEMKDNLKSEAALFDRSGKGIGTYKVLKPVALIEWYPESSTVDKLDFLAKSEDVSNMSGIKNKFVKFEWFVPDDISSDDVISIPPPRRFRDFSFD